MWFRIACVCVCMCIACNAWGGNDLVAQCDKQAVQINDRCKGECWETLASQLNGTVTPAFWAHTRMYMYFPLPLYQHLRIRERLFCTYSKMASSQFLFIRGMKEFSAMPYNLRLACVKRVNSFTAMFLGTITQSWRLNRLSALFNKSRRFSFELCCKRQRRQHMSPYVCNCLSSVCLLTNWTDCPGISVFPVKQLANVCWHTMLSTERVQSVIYCTRTGDFSVRSRRVTALSLVIVWMRQISNTRHQFCCVTVENEPVTWKQRRIPERTDKSSVNWWGLEMSDP